MKDEKKNFQKPTVEVIEFDKKDDIKTDFSTISGTADNPVNPPNPSNDPPLDD